MLAEVAGGFVGAGIIPKSEARFGTARLARPEGTEGTTGMSAVALLTVGAVVSVDVWGTAAAAVDAPVTHAIIEGPK